MPNEEEAEERPVRQPKRKYTRRAFLKYAAKIGLGAALWGAGGYLGGKLFKSTVKPVIRGGLIIYQKAGRKLRNFGIIPRPQQVTRRGFLNSLLIKGYKHPVAAGALVGATYGTGKYALKGIGKYLTERQIAKLKDENTDYKERLELLEKYRTGVQKDLEGKGARIDYLEKQLTNVNAQIRILSTKPGKLELTAGEAVGEEETPSEPETLPLIIGGAGLLISIVLSTMTLTGNVVLNENINQAFFANIALFIVSLILVVFGIRFRRK